MNTIERTARKPHRCTLCGEIIAPGEKYAYARITPWDHPDNDSFSNYKAHPLCDEVWCEVDDSYDCIFPNGGEGWKQDLAAHRPVEVAP